MDPFFTVSQRPGSEGIEYVLNLPMTGETLSLFDGDEDYWVLANLIDRLFPAERKVL